MASTISLSALGPSQLGKERHSHLGHGGAREEQILSCPPKTSWAEGMSPVTPSLPWHWPRNRRKDCQEERLRAGGRALRVPGGPSPPTPPLLC